MTTKKQFIEKVSKYIDISLYDVKYKIRKQYKTPEPEIWLYKKSSNQTKAKVCGYKCYDTGKEYKTKDEMIEDGVERFDYLYKDSRCRDGVVVTDEDIEDEEWLKIYLSNNLDLKSTN